MDKIISFLKSSPLFSQFSANDFAILAPFISVQKFTANEWIFREGEKGGEFYIIQEGSVEALKELGEGFQPETLGILGPHECFGEMAYLEKGQRSASVRAIESTTVITIEFKNTSPKSVEIENKLSTALLKKISSRLRKTDEILVDNLRKKLEISNTHSQIGELIIYLFIVMSVSLVSEGLIGRYLGQYQFQVELILHPVFIILVGISTLFLIKRFPYPWKFYGITLNNWKKNIWGGIVYSIPVCAFLFFVKWFLITFVPDFKSLPLIDLSPHRIGMPLYLLENGIYLLLVPIQELIVRGLLQNCFRNFFQGPNRVYNAILASNLTFLIFHTAISAVLAIGIFVTGIFWGFLFERQKSLVGVAVSHAITGWVLFFLLNYYSVHV